MKLFLDSIVALGLDGLTSDALRSEESKIGEFLDAFEARKQGFTMLPKAKAQVLAVKTMAERMQGKFDDIVVCGIGGSALGVNCLRDALMGPYWNMKGSPRLLVLDNLDLVDEIESVIDMDKTLFVIISKSGRTPETMAMYYYFKSKVSKENFLFITDPEGGELRKIGGDLKIPMLNIPKDVGGRFSVLTPVGLFPIAMLGIDIVELLDGAQEVVDSFYEKEFAMNLPFQIAAAQYLLEHEHGIPMTVMMPYSTRLATFSDWYAQLLAESIGKDGKGLTPIGALGVTDQHSQLQLYNEGPRDKLIILIEVEKDDSSKIPDIENEALCYLSGVSFQELMNTEKRATEQALAEYEKPTINIQIPEVSPHVLGQLFMLFEASIAFLGEYYRIDAFNQPGVELGKKLTKELLSK